jgi:nicotinate-nucleotide--dimethylbenzimidazole phosphoribosyltransferase
MTLQQSLIEKINNKTKPVGALGMLEEIALQIGTVQQTLTPQINQPHILIFAADHGIAATGLVNPYPQAVTAQMVQNFVQGGAAINVFCKQNNITLQVVDAGVNIDFDKHLPIRHCKIAKGTNNYLEQDAMSIQQCNEAIQAGEKLVEEMYNKGCNCIAFGEMGIGNTSAASLIMSAIVQMPIADCVGRGTGVTDDQLATKVTTLQQVFNKHNLQQFSKDPLALLTKVGGFEIAMMVGAFVKAASLHMIIVVDGFITTAALLLANSMDASIKNNCVFAHTSGEAGHAAMLHYLQTKPLLQLGLRLGEGTGAALAMPIIQAAVNFLNEMASFETAGVSNK